MGLLLFILLILLIFGGLPNWGYHSYGYWPSGGLGLLLLILIILIFLGYL
jgi:hypothetical protein